MHTLPGRGRGRLTGKRRSWGSPASQQYLPSRLPRGSMGTCSTSGRTSATVSHWASCGVVCSHEQQESPGGVCVGVPGQHSWVVMASDPQMKAHEIDVYDPRALIIDPTIWSYDPQYQGVLAACTSDKLHKPHGSGSIWDYGCPSPIQAGEVAIPLKDVGKLSPYADAFLHMIGPLSRRGWSCLLHAPVQGWPAKEILEAADDTPELRALIPIDILGMVTPRNPSGLYLPVEEKSPAEGSAC